MVLVEPVPVLVPVVPVLPVAFWVALPVFELWLELPVFVVHC